MSAVLDDGVALTPRSHDPGARRSESGIFPRSGRLARSAELIEFRVWILGMTAAPQMALAAIKQSQLLHLSSPDDAKLHSRDPAECADVGCQLPPRRQGRKCRLEGSEQK
jgi:hypothetical protein